MAQSVECTIGDRLLTIETGKLANQANSAVTVRYGDTIILVTACIGDKSREGLDFVQLTVDYEERHYSVGKIPGSFMRRESRPGEQATLTCRLTDRSIRPLFYKSVHNDIQVVATVLSVDQENGPDILAVIGASAALTLSSIPFDGPISAVRIGYINDSIVLNPTWPQMNDSLLDLVVASTKEAVIMLEAGAKEVSEEVILEAIKFGHETNQAIIKLQEEMQRACGRPKMETKTTTVNPELSTTISSDFGDKLTQAVSQTDRVERDTAIESIKQEAVEKLAGTIVEADIIEAVNNQLKKAARIRILDKRLHLDGRQAKEIRPLSSEVSLLPRTHGSGLFTRGQTQVLTTTTLGSSRQEQLIDGLGLEETKRFMHHYNFPPFSNGEVKRMGTPGRREIGHGALAEKAIAPIIPNEEEFSYTIRLVSEVLSSNGSTSMASVCSSSLSLMDAGVPIKAPVAGIAIGLVTGENDDYVILTDIEGMEDHWGDMDFKVAGTSQGITAIQLDIKLQGINYEIIAGAIKQARDAHSEILDNLRQAISSSRPELSRYAPRIYRLTIDQSKIGSVIGPGGKTIRSITDETKATINVENDGTVIIGSANEEAAQKAIAMVENLTREVEVGVIYTGKVTRLTGFGAFVEILPGKEGLVHISELADYRVAKVEDIVNVGDEITVKVTEIDNFGRVNLSRRAILANSPQVQGAGDVDPASTDRYQQRQPRPHPDAHQRNNRDTRYRPYNKK